ncbi:uncharacterized protein [Henckelia pumila]|uniref:uncharacterized protein n=1 Tax=Henckelia pumila TaxID=405737 RepID=UPI003C6E9555
MDDTRSWMYRRLENGFVTNEFFNGVEEFVNFAKMHPEIMCGQTMRCPCNHRKCRNRAYHDEDEVKLHLCRYGFVPDYYRWHHHGETYITPEVEHWVGSSSSTQVENVDNMQNMVHNIYNSINIEDEPQSPNQTAKSLYEMLRASETEIWDGNPNGHSQLSVVARLLNMKVEHHISERCYDDLCQLISELLPTENFGKKTYDVHSKTNFSMRASLLWTISDFPAYAMLFGWSTAGKLACPYCMEDSDAFTLPHGGKQSWFDNHRKFLPIDHNFRRNIKWFKKNHQVKKPPPHIKSGDEIIEELESYGFRSVTEPGATEVNSEIVRRCKCGWRKRSIFWELPYWRTNLIRHNLDVMHIEKNVFDNIFNTVLNAGQKITQNREKISKNFATGQNYIEMIYLKLILKLVIH